jgi:hypothetical protein
LYQEALEKDGNGTMTEAAADEMIKRFSKKSIAASGQTNLDRFMKQNQTAPGKVRVLGDSIFWLMILMRSEPGVVRIFRWQGPEGNGSDGVGGRSLCELLRILGNALG